MRRDMNEVLVEVARSGGRYNNRERKPRRVGEEYEGYPVHFSIGRGWKKDRKSQGDKLGPLEGFLRSSIGRQWNDVYAEICRVNDKRSMLGHHLFSHLRQMVTAPGFRESRFLFHSTDFFADTDGTLQETKRKNWREKKKERVKEIQLDSGWYYRLHDGFWFREKVEEVVGKIPKLLPYGVIEWRNGVVETKHHKFQCSKKELKTIRALIVQWQNKALVKPRRRSDSCSLLHKQDNRDGRQTHTRFAGRV